MLQVFRGEVASLVEVTVFRALGGPLLHEGGDFLPFGRGAMEGALEDAAFVLAFEGRRIETRNRFADEAVGAVKAVLHEGAITVGFALAEIIVIPLLQTHGIQVLLDAGISIAFIADGHILVIIGHRFDRVFQEFFEENAAWVVAKLDAAIKHRRFQTVTGKREEFRR